MHKIYLFYIFNSKTIHKLFLILLLKCMLKSEEFHRLLIIVSGEIILYNFLILPIKIKGKQCYSSKSPRKCVAELKLETRHFDFWFNFLPLLLLAYVA